MKFNARYLFFGLLFILALLVRLYKIDNSMTEWFSWRQTDTMAVGKFFVKDGIDLLHPRYYDLSNIQSGLDNPQGYRMVEFPVYNALFATLYTTFGTFSLEVWARLIAIVCSLLAMAVIVYILDREYGLTEAFFGGLFFALAPFAVFYSRATLPDMPSVSMATIALFFFYLYKTRERKNLLYIVLGTAFFALALLIKPVVVFYALIAVFFIWQKHKKVLPSLFWSGFFLMLAALPVLVWRTYIKGFPEGIPANSWLLTSVNTSAGLQSVFFRPAFFRWIFFERLNNLILGGYLTFFFLMGILVVNPKKSKFHLIFGAAALMYLLVFQGGNVQHEYYQTIIIPAVSVLVGVGAGLYLKEKKAPLLILKLLFTITIFVVSFLFSFYLVKDKYSENQGQVLMADVVRSLTKETDIIVTDSMGDTTLLYLADRKGYPAPYRELPLLKEQGARYFVTMNLEYKAKLVPQYKLVFENDSFLIFAL